ncbi:MAG TPA: hypothetical protein VGK46_01590, partial [Saprospiraceae bacterium]
MYIERIDQATNADKIILENCHVTGNGCGLKLFGNENMIQIINSNFDHLGKYSIYADFTDSLEIINNQFFGELESFSLNSVKFYDNKVHQETNFVGEFINNTFYGRADLTGSLAEHNTFHFITNLGALYIRNNTFLYSLNISYLDNVEFNLNKCFGKFNMSFCQQAIINANQFKNEASISFCYGSLVSNNIILKEFDLGLSDFCKIYNNNFGPGANLRNSAFDAKIKNNNFSQEIESGNFSSLIDHNNYYPRGGIYDDNPFSINPFYLDTSLVATNPLLIGKGLVAAEVKNDFNGTLRSEPPTIGAHE